MDAQKSTSHAIKVIGHRHPDTDSVCAAIAYSRLKERTDPEHCYEPCRAGILSRETEFVLSYFSVPSPRFFIDVSPQIRDVDLRREPGLAPQTSLRQAWVAMRDRKADTLCVVDEKEQLIGLIATRDMVTASMDTLDEGILAKAETSYKNILETLEATVVVGDIQGKVVQGNIVVGAGSPEMIESAVKKGDVVILSNRSDGQLAAIEMEAGCIIVCTGATVSRSICMLAQEKGCIILATDMNTYTAGQMIVQSVPISHYMVRENLLTFTPDSSVETATRIMANIRYRYFPILDADGRYLGIISRRNLLNLHRKQLILVDHNELSQAVDGVDSADVLEIIDHHRISPLMTESPIYFRNEPVGCTCTIIFQMYREAGVEIEPSIAGLMLSAILSDTLMFRSPTCTVVDEAAARALAEIAGVELEAYAEAMFEAGSDVTGKTPDEILNTDFKIFGKDKVRFGVSQNNFMTKKSRAASIELVRPYLKGFMKKHGLDYLFCMFTDVPTTTTELLMVGKGAEEVARRAFGAESSEGSALLPGMVSRKKQFVPALLQTLEQMG